MIHNLWCHWESRCERCASRCESWWVMLSQWLWITVCYAEPIVVKHFEWFLDIGCESFMIHIHWHSIIRHVSQSLAKHCTTWFTTTGTSWLAIIHNHWLSIAQHDSQPLAQDNSVGKHDVNAVPVGVNHGGLCWASGCESRCAMLSQLLWSIVNDT
jgi:hypothetical protein